MKTKTYRQKAAILRKVGFKVSLGAKGSTQGQLAQKKSAITRAWNRVGAFIESGSHKFVPASRWQRDAFASRKAKSPAGFFQPIPAGVDPGKIRYKIQGSVLRQRVNDPKEGQVRTDHILKLDPRKVAAFGQDYIKEVIQQYASQVPKGKLSFQLMVNGWDGRNTYTTKDIGKYMIEKFLPSLRGQKLKSKTVSDIFHLKIISQGDGPRGRPLGEYDEDEEMESDEDQDEDQDEDSDQDEGDPF